jgi:three-Cys-motif partner protein
MDPHEAERLFALPTPDPIMKMKPMGLPVWTASKARLIQRYLELFVRITKHGTYIDGFAGPQRPSVDEYAAKLVIETDPTRFYLSGEPARLRHFHLFDVGRQQIEALYRLREEHPKRDVNVYHDDFNHGVNAILCPEVLKLTEATFCLLDQRTFECEWKTVRRLADYKREAKYKIELFYFLANFWFERSIAGLRSGSKLEDVCRGWWGRDDWAAAISQPRRERQEELRKRFKTELGYRFSNSFPIYGVEDRKTRIMYYMIHATDHPEAPKLMKRAYLKSVWRDSFEQLPMYPLQEA